jgi:hypothetical protein
MKIQLLFDELEKIKETSKLDFEISGMVNRFNEMKYGFFPLGLGILTENNKTNEEPLTDEIEVGGVMVLGNDFGTVTYVNDLIKDSDGFGEIKGTIVRNMKKHIPELFTNKTFFTNFYLGVRTNKDAKMMVKIEELSDGYKTLYYDFFRMQLDLVKPKLVVCLGHHVKNALISSGGVFEQWKTKSGSLKELYSHGKDKYIIENAALNGIKFIIIPHPCYPVNLLKPPYLQKLNAFLKSN